MRAARFNALRARLDALKDGNATGPDFWARTRALFERAEAVDLEPLRTLDSELELAGVHSSADARLLRELSATKGRLGTLARGLAARADEALNAFELAVSAAEKGAAGQAAAWLTLEDDYRRLARIVKVAAVFSAPEAHGFSMFSVERSASSRPSSARLATVEHLMTRARANVGDTVQKRRDLDVAHELLLRMGQVAKADRDRARQLRVELGDARARTRDAAPVRTLNDLVKHVRHSARRDPQTAYRSLRSLYERALEANDGELAEAAAEATRAMLPTAAVVGAAIDEAELKRALGLRGPTPAALKAGGAGALKDTLADLLAELAFDLDTDRRQALELAIGASRFFDIEDTLSEEVIEAQTGALRPVQRRVSYPTQRMTYEFTNSLGELNNFVITHPGSVVLDLAANRQLVRAYLEEEPPPKKKKQLQTAVRAYVLDASGSMHGARARLRDALLIGELNAVRVRARLGIPFDPLYYSYFNDAPFELNRVDSGEEATRHIERLFKGSPAQGQTNITLALLSAFDSIRLAQGRDPYLARATVVLVTDGEDGVDVELVRRARSPLSGLDITLSFISLGEENVDLKKLVFEQRDRGGRAFYHHLADAEIALARTEFDSTRRTLLPAELPLTADSADKLLPALEALEAIAAGRAVAQAPRVDASFAAYFPARAQPSSVAVAVVDRVTDILEAVAEAAAFAPPEQRAVEAVMLLKHLLATFELTTEQYLTALGAASAELQQARRRVDLVCRPFEANEAAAV